MIEIECVCVCACVRGCIITLKMRSSAATVRLACAIHLTPRITRLFLLLFRSIGLAFIQPKMNCMPGKYIAFVAIYFTFTFLSLSLSLVCVCSDRSSARFFIQIYFHMGPIFVYCIVVVRQLIKQNNAHINTISKYKHSHTHTDTRLNRKLTVQSTFDWIFSHFFCFLPWRCSLSAEWRGRKSLCKVENACASPGIRMFHLVSMMAKYLCIHKLVRSNEWIHVCMNEWNDMHWQKLKCSKCVRLYACVWLHEDCGR